MSKFPEWKEQFICILLLMTNGEDFVVWTLINESYVFVY